MADAELSQFDIFSSKAPLPQYNEGETSRGVLFGAVRFKMRARGVRKRKGCDSSLDGFAHLIEERVVLVVDSGLHLPIIIWL